MLKDVCALYKASFLLHCRPASSGQCPFSGAAPAVKEYIFSRFAIILPLSGKYTLSAQCFLICCQIIYCENQQNFCQRIFSLFMLAYSFLLIMFSHFFEDFYLRPIWHDLKLWKQIWHVFSCIWLKTKPSINPTTTSLVPNDHLLFRYISFHPSPWMYTLEIM